MAIAQSLSESTLFSDIDREFGRFCGRHATPKAGPVVAMLAALVSHARSRGDSCLLLEDWAGKPIEEPRLLGHANATLILPPLEACRALLTNQPLISDGTRPTPLVLDGNRLYLYRYWRAETDLATFFTQRMTQPYSLVFSQHLKDCFHDLFGTLGQEVDWQAVGAFAALQHSFTLITGGPGTGKTTTVVRLLAILLNQKPNLKIALAAPTGKAVARLAESIVQQITRIPEHLSRNIPTQVQTLHRLLGYLPYKDTFRFDQHHPLACDLVIVDEASMVDILMMANLVKALPPTCQLILLGDHQQLASVDAGSILTDICQAANLRIGHSPGFADAYNELTNQNLSASQLASPLRDQVVYLQKSRRFNDTTGLGAFSKAVQVNDISGALQVLNTTTHRDLQRLDLPADDSGLLQFIEPHLLAMLRAKSVEKAFQIFQSWQLLTGLREGRTGVSGLNQMIESYLRRKGVPFTGSFYPGRPILVTQNDYSNQLFNGDLGVCWPEADRQLRAFFPDSKGGFSSIPLMKLSTVESAWALTVHKSQGSEFHEVLFILPPADHPLCTRELLYTGVTRARSKATLLASPLQVSQALERATHRASGLVERLIDPTSHSTS